MNAMRNKKLSKKTYQQNLLDKEWGKYTPWPTALHPRILLASPYKGSSLTLGMLRRPIQGKPHRWVPDPW